MKETPYNRLGQEIAAESLRDCFGACLDASGNPLLVVDDGPTVVVANQPFAALLQQDAQTLVGCAQGAILAQLANRLSDPDGFWNAVQAATGREPAHKLNIGADSATVSLRDDPRRRYLLGYTPLSRHGKPLGGVWSLEDASELSPELSWLHAMAEHAACGWMIARLDDGRVLYTNPETGRLFGVPAEVLVSENLWSRFVEPAVAERWERELRQGGPLRERQAIMHRPDGSTFWARWSLSVINPDGHEPLIAAQLLDVTEQKRMEAAACAGREAIQQLKLQLIKSEKMAALGALVAGVAHEINTPVGAMLSTHDTLARAWERLRGLVIAETLPPKERALPQIIDECGRVMCSATNRVAEIVRHLRCFARLDGAECRPASLEDGLDDTLLLLRHELKNRVEIERHYGGLPQIPCYPGSLNQVFLNLLMNASQAIEGKGRIRIDTFAQDDVAHVRISDSGKGIPEQDLPRIFDPGFTTKCVDTGTGLGLSICREIIEKHGGTIAACNLADGGSRFELSLPLRGPQPGSACGEAQPLAACDPHASVLDC